MPNITRKELIKFLRSNSNIISTSTVNKLKIIYRPLISPFNDLLQMINEKDKVFDIGCGLGQFVLLALHYKEVKKIGGIDLHKDLIIIAKKLLKNYEKISSIAFFQYDGEKFPSSFHEYNLFFLIDVLHHVPKYKQVDFLKNIYNHMPSNSKLIIKDIDSSNWLVLFNKIHDLILAGEIGNELNPSSLKEELKRIGFEVSEIYKKRIYFYPYYTLVAKKE